MYSTVDIEMYIHTIILHHTNLDVKQSSLTCKEYQNVTFVDRLHLYVIHWHKVQN